MNFPVKFGVLSLLVLVVSVLLFPSVLQLGRRFLSAMSEGLKDHEYLPGEFSIAYVTAPGEDVAKKLANDLVKNKLAACVNIIPTIHSVYEWKNEIQNDSETLMVIKTRTSRIDDVTTFIRKNHPYEVCEVISVPLPPKHRIVPTMVTIHHFVISPLPNQSYHFDEVQSSVKKVLTAYNLFVQETAQEIEGKSSDRLINASKKWSQLDKEEKAVWHEKVKTFEQPRKVVIAGKMKSMFVCSRCNRKFSHHRHFAYHHKQCGREFDCEICFKTFQNKSDLQRHKKTIHFGVKKYRCPTCHKGFRDRTSLTRHEGVKRCVSTLYITIAADTCFDRSNDARSVNEERTAPEDMDVANFDGSENDIVPRDGSVPVIYSSRVNDSDIKKIETEQAPVVDNVDKGDDGIGQVPNEDNTNSKVENTKDSYELPALVDGREVYVVSRDDSAPETNTRDGNSALVEMDVAKVMVV